MKKHDLYISCRCTSCRSSLGTTYLVVPNPNAESDLLTKRSATGTRDPHKALATKDHWCEPKSETDRLDVCDTIVTAAKT